MFLVTLETYEVLSLAKKESTVCGELQTVYYMSFTKSQTQDFVKNILLLEIVFFKRQVTSKMILFSTVTGKLWKTGCFVQGRWVKIGLI